MSQQWFCRVGGKDHGPFTGKQLKQLAMSGKLKPSDSDWTEGKQPRPASQVKGLISSREPEASASEHVPQTKLKAVQETRDIPVESAGIERSTASVPSFVGWYKTKWPSNRRWYWQILIWLFYGFAWIPLWYFLSATRGGFRARWKSLGFTGKAVCSLPVLTLVALTFWSFGDRQSSTTSEDNPEIAQAVAENLSTLPESFSQLEKSWTLPSPELQKVATWHGMSEWDCRDFQPLNPFQHDRYTVFNGPEQTIRIWNKKTNTEVMPKSETSDYFTRLAAFSQSGNYLACIDGDLVRIWEIHGDTATLASSVSAPSAPAWTAIDWVADSSVFIQVGVNDSKGFPRVSEVKVDGGVANSAVEVFSNRRLQDFRASAAEFSPARRQAFLMTYAYEQERVSQEELSPNEEFERLKQNGGRRPKKEYSVVPVGIDVLKENKSEAILGCRLPESENGFLFPCFTSSCSRSDTFLSCFPFNDANRLAALSSSRDKQTLFVFDVKDWEQLAEIPLEAPSMENGEETIPRFVAVSSNDRFIAQCEIDESRSSRGKQLQSTLNVWDTETSKAVFKQFFNGRLVHVSFVDKDRSVFGAVQSAEGWQVLRGSLATGKAEFTAVGTGSPMVVSVSPDGSQFILGGILWDRHGFEQIHNLVEKGDQFYEQDQWKKARTHYSTVLLDSMAQNMWWKRDTEFPELWGRCFDCYAAEQRNDEAASLLTYCDNNEIEFSPNAAEGKALLSSIRTRQEEERRRIAQKEQQRADDALAEIRAENQSKFVPAETLTRAAFVAQLRDAMSRGRIDDGRVNAVFDNYSFQDRIGRPDRDLSYVDTKRLYYYTCSDGVVGLTVTVIRSSVFVSEIDLY